MNANIVNTKPQDKISSIDIKKVVKKTQKLMSQKIPMIL